MFPENADTNIIEQIAEKVASANPTVAINSLENLGDYDLKEAFKDISVPVYSINSDFWSTNLESNKNYIKSFEVKIIPGVGHCVMLEDPDKFNEYLDEIIKKHDSQN
jgi:pimeloyl-ACP methyl ester carboxylesterase